jgi:hypothetical protein
MPQSLQLLVQVQSLPFHQPRYNDVSYFAGHNPGISILGGLAVVSVTEPLALPWVALGTVTPFILGYRVVGDKIVISQAPKYITESLAKTEMYEMGVVGTFLHRQKH